MKTIPTAEEFLKQLDEESGTMWAEDNDEICKAFIQFAKLHVEACVEKVQEKVCLTDFAYEFLQEGASNAIDKQSIEDAYPLNLIK